MTNETKRLLKVLKATYNHTGKMAHMVSISTSPTLNKLCKIHAQILGSICQKCYSQKMNKRYKALNEMLNNNYDILTTRELTTDEIESLNFHNYKYVRLEAFGDIENGLQMFNYLKIVEYYHDTNFALWTKNPLQVASGLKKAGYTKASGKPENLNIILSSLMLNEKTNSKLWFVDKVFSVYDKKTIEDKQIVINCGAKKCMNCLICYKKNDITEVNEKLK